MRWLILGAGALGGYYGARLIDAGEDVTFLVRAKRQLQLTQRGLRVYSSAGSTHVLKPKTILAQDVKADYDGVIVGAKAYDLDSAMDAIAPAVQGDTFVLPLLNGMSHLDVLKQRFGDARVLGGVCFISAALDRNGDVVHYNEQHRLGFGELDGRESDRYNRIKAAFANANFASEPSTHILQKMWEKWIFIATIAGATCLMRASVGDIVNAGGASVMDAMYTEAKAIADANHFPPRAHVEKSAREFMASPKSALMASMLKDVERYKRTEAEHILGELIARKAATAETPLLTLAYTHLLAYDVRRRREKA